ncbi:hypothetical protein QA601_00385 [Chitinispirillales bacterium ANBcel5]|uniref:hypothetical protein n=1 Tax=Cellulosispirillum alkaliphilum TaxID=3039283 RepID=UPI002A52C045|nr:hypothetical protein [Chitinispirillales bacterium ANBcel5]
MNQLVLYQSGTYESFILVLFFSLSLLTFFSCETPTHPFEDYRRADIQLLFHPDTKEVAYTIGDTIECIIEITMPHLFESISVKNNSYELVFDNTDTLHKDTLSFKIALPEPGEYEIVLRGYLKNNSNVKFSLITIHVEKPDSDSTYSILYTSSDHNDGNVPTDTVYYSTGQSTVVRGNIGSLKRTGFTFMGWGREVGK